MKPEIEERLRGHVAATLARAGVPAAARDDLVEELFGHLGERWRAHVAEGLTERAAAERAIIEFGAADRVGRDFGRAYHSRLWASTIGVLLPGTLPIATRPAIIGWLRLFLAIVTILLAIALVTGLAVLTPLRALIDTAALGIALTATILAFRALARGQLWAAWWAGGVLIITLITGVWQMVAPPRPETIIIPLGSMLATALLLGMYVSRSALRTYVAASGRVGRLVVGALALSLLAPLFVPAALAALPDPTQATAADLALRLSMRCDRGDVPMYPLPRQRVTLVADMSWRRTDVLPGGLAGLLRPAEDGDTAGFRLVGQTGSGPEIAALPAWLLGSNDLPIFDIETGATAGWFGAGSPSEALIPDTIGSFTIGIKLSAIRAGHTIRAKWLLTPTSDAGAAWPRIEVAYAHLDRFLIIGTVGCGENVLGRPALLPPVSLSALSGLRPDFGIPLP